MTGTLEDPLKLFKARTIDADCEVRLNSDNSIVLDSADRISVTRNQFEKIFWLKYVQPWATLTAPNPY